MLIKSLDHCLLENKFQLFSLNAIDSTMNEAKSKVDSTNDNFIVIAKEQTKGIGRRGNKWISPIGNIYCSIAFLTQVPLSEYFKFGMLTSVAIKSSLKHIGIHEIYFKWPNDIYYKNKKISGIIQESIVNKNKKNILIIGIGINFLSSPKLACYETTYITKYVKNLSYEKYFEIFINYFLFYFKEFIINDNIDFILNFKNSQMFLKKNIKIKINDNKIIIGQFLGISEEGALILKHKEKYLSIYSGQIQ